MRRASTYCLLGSRVEAARRLVEDERARVCEDGSCYGQKLALSLAEVGAAFGETLRSPGQLGGAGDGI
jgi:hypothetical protein